jgi:hypothetical protein
MKSTSFFTLVSFGVALVASQAQAQLQQPTHARPVSLNYTYYAQDADPDQTAPSPSDVPPPTVEDAMIMQDEPEVADDYACEEDGGPVHLFHECHGIQVGGWVNGGIYANGDGVTSGTGNLPVLFPQSSDGFQMDQLWIYAEKALPDDPCCHDWGFRIDYVFGTDGPDTQAFGDIGWDNGWNSSRDYGSAIPQLYVEYGNSDMSVKAGHFYTIIGYEVVPAPDNFFYTHAYTMLYAEPFTHTGVLVSKSLGCNLSVTGGWTQGWDSGFNNANDADTFLGSISWTSCDEKLGVTYAVSAGDFGGEIVDGNEGNIYMHSLVATYQINECMEYVLHHDYFNNTDTAAGTLTATGINQYLFYTLSSCYKLGLRAEWFNDEDGARVAQPDGNPGGYGGGDFYSVTAGLNYTPNSNVIIRPEVRYDWFHGVGDPFGDGTEDEMFYYGFDFIVLF